METKVRAHISILGCGWLGLTLAEHFVSAGHQVKASTTTPDKLRLLSDKGIDPYLLSIDSTCNEEFLDSDILIVSITSKEVTHFKNLIDQLEHSTIRRILFVSSTSVYRPSVNPITEVSDVLPTPLVQIEKLFLENHLFKTSILRFGGLIGYDRKPGRFFRKGKKLRDPENVVNLIHRDDCIGIIEAVIQCQSWGEIFNGCADTHPTKMEFYTKAAIAIGLEPPTFDINGDMSRKWISNEKIKRKLNYKLKFPDLMNMKFE